MPREITRRPIITGPDGSKIRATTAGGAQAKVERTFRQWAAQRVQYLQVGARLDKLKVDMKAYVDASGLTDDKGHKTIPFPEPIVVGGITYTGLRNEARKTTRLDEERAEEILRSLGVYDDCTTTITILDQDKIYALFQEDKIPEKVLEEIFVTTINYAFKPDKLD